VALTTAGEDETDLARRIISVNPSHSLNALLNHARLCKEAGGQVFTCRGPRGSSDFNQVPFDLSVAVLKREEARTALLAAPEEEQAQLRRRLADLRFNFMMLAWARVQILRAEGTRDPQVAALLAASGEQGEHLAPAVAPTKTHPRKRSRRPDAEWDSLRWQTVLLATHDRENLLIQDQAPTERKDVLERQVMAVHAPLVAQALVEAAVRLPERTEDTDQVAGELVVPGVGSVPAAVLHALATREQAHTARRAAPAAGETTRLTLDRTYARADVALWRALLDWARADIVAGEAARDPKAAAILAAAK